MEAGDEPVEVVDDQGRVLRIVPRHVMRAEALQHRCTYVLVVNGRRHLYVHRRTPTKDIYPGFYDVTAGGVCAVGESFYDAAARELREELGVNVRPTFRFAHRYDGEESHVLGAVYDVVWDGPIHHQRSEVAWGEFLALDDVDRMIARERFCPDGIEAYRRWRGEASTP